MSERDPPNAMRKLTRPAPYTLTGPFSPRKRLQFCPTDALPPLSRCPLNHHILPYYQIISPYSHGAGISSQAPHTSRHRSSFQVSPSSSASNLPEKLSERTAHLTSHPHLISLGIQSHLRRSHLWICRYVHLGSRDGASLSVRSALFSRALD